MLERDRKAREAKALEQRRLETEKREEQRREEVRRDIRIDNRDTRVDTRVDVKKRYNSVSSTSKVEPVTEHKFKPSPVISPVYGILDKNYRKEDILPRASSEGTLPKIMDVDNVRKKAFGILEQNMDTNEVLQDFKGDSEIPLEKIDENLDEDIMGKTIKIDVDDVKNELDKKEEIDSSDTKAGVKKDDEALEKDLFNLIDSMYETREDK